MDTEFIFLTGGVVSSARRGAVKLPLRHSSARALEKGL